MDGTVQLHTLEGSPHCAAPGWRAQRAEQAPRRARRQAARLQAQPLTCHTVTYRCHTGRVKVHPPAAPARCSAAAAAPGGLPMAAQPAATGHAWRACHVEHAVHALQACRALLACRVPAVPPQQPCTAALGAPAWPGSGILSSSACCRPWPAQRASRCCSGPALRTAPCGSTTCASRAPSARVGLGDWGLERWSCSEDGTVRQFDMRLPYAPGPPAVRFPAVRVFWFTAPCDSSTCGSCAPLGPPLSGFGFVGFWVQSAGPCSEDATVRQCNVRLLCAPKPHPGCAGFRLELSVCCLLA